MRVGIVGGGLTGLALARLYALDGHEVTVVEYAEQLGGLATWSPYGGFDWDKFNRILQPSDHHFIDFIKDLDLEDHLHWRHIPTGLYVEGNLHPIGCSKELLKLPALSLLAKLRLRFTLLYVSHLASLKSLESITIDEWLRKVSGNESVEKFWKPLLTARFGAGYSRASAAVGFSHIKRMLPTQDNLQRAGCFGYVKGGCKSIYNKVEKELKSKGGRVLLKETVLRVSCGDDGVSVHTPQRKLVFDQVVCTNSPGDLARIVDQDLLDLDQNKSSVEYLGVVCIVLVAKKSLTEYYAVNVADDSVPFADLIDVSNMVDVEDTAGNHLIYLPRYLLSGDPEMNKPDSYFREKFLDGVKRMFPDFSMQDVVSVHVHRAANVQPLQVIGSPASIAPTSTRDPRLHVLNASQSFRSSLNGNEVIGAVNDFYQQARVAGC